MDQNSNEVVAPVVAEVPLIFEEKKTQLLSKDYTEVNPDLLVSPDTNPVFTKIFNWSNKPFPEEYKDRIKAFFQNMNPENAVIAVVQGHAKDDECVKIETTEHGDKTITTITGTTFDGEPAVASTEDDVIIIFSAPFTTLNLTSSNFNNKVVGNLLEPENHETIVNAVKTGNADSLFEYISYDRDRQIKEEYKKCIIGLPGCCPNFLLDFYVKKDPEERANASWAAFVATSEAPPRNVKSLMSPRLDKRARNMPVANPVGTKIETSLLNDKYKFFGNTPQAIAAETEFKAMIHENDGEIYIQDFIKNIKKAFPGKKIICFIDTCSQYNLNIVGKVKVKNEDDEDDEDKYAIVSLLVDQKIDKDKMNTPNLISPEYGPIFQKYLKACSQFNPIRIPTIYNQLQQLRLQNSGIPPIKPIRSIHPVYNIDYSPIVKLGFESTIKMLNAIRNCYLECAIEDPDFSMGQMDKIQIKIDSELAVASQLNDEGQATTDSQVTLSQNYTTDLPLYSWTEPMESSEQGGVCVSTRVFANVANFVRNLFKREPRCNNPLVTYTLQPGEMDPIKDEDGPFVSFSASGGGGGGGGGGGRVFRPSFNSSAGAPFALPSLGLIPPPPGGGGPDVNSSTGPPVVFQGLGLNTPPSSSSVFQDFRRVPPKTLSGKQGGLNPNAPKGGSTKKNKTRRTKTRKTKTRKTKKNKRTKAKKTRKNKKTRR
jgi:hypothetical protein